MKLSNLIKKISPTKKDERPLPVSEEKLCHTTDNSDHNDNNTNNTNTNTNNNNNSPSPPSSAPNNNIISACPHAHDCHDPNDTNEHAAEAVIACPIRSRRVPSVVLNVDEKKEEEHNEEQHHHHQQQQHHQANTTTTTTNANNGNGVPATTRSFEPRRATSAARMARRSGPLVAASTRALATSGQCPFRHGTVYSDPYPGYVHGNPKKGICPNGCRPEMNTDVTGLENPKETLLREAMEYMELYYHERKDEIRKVDGFLEKEERMDVIKDEIDATGTYEHTFDELQHGARVAWRNAPKCANRKYWQQLKLLDCRNVTTNKGMFDSSIEHLAKAMSCGSSEAYITVFKPAPPEKGSDGPRIWNDQLLQYAAYSDSGKVIGDPKNLRFTEMLKERFGWDGPPDGKKGSYDYLPLVVQADPKGPPELFEVPLECARPVDIHHPRYPELSSLNMRWYPIPAVCALDMTVGGITYTAVPFNGWYANTEVLRDLTDEGRYNMLVPVAKALGMETDLKPGEAPLWKDEVMSILSMAVYHSYKSAKVAMIDHHTLIDMFWDWYRDEMASRKYCPVNWKWVIPPMSSSTNRAYLGLSKAQEFTLKPAYLLGRSPFQLETNYFGRRDTSKSVKKFVQCVYLAILFKKIVTRIRERKQPVLIIYASVTGNSAKHASDLGAILRGCSNVSYFDACGVNAAADEEVISSIHNATLTIFISSTQGNGELPSLCRKFFSSLFENNGSVLTGKHCAVLGFGSSAYPIFCGAAIHISKKLAEKGAKEIVSRGECDAVKGEAPTFYKWTTKLVTKMASLPLANPLVLKLSENMKESTASSLVQSRNMLSFVKVELFTREEVENAAAQSYMSTRRGSMGTISKRKSTTMMDMSSHSREEIRAPRVMQIIGASNFQDSDEKFVEGRVKSRTDIISTDAREGEREAVTRKTSLVKIDLQSCGNPPYQPGDHVRVSPRDVTHLDELESFVNHLSYNDETEDLSLDDHMYVSFQNDDVPMSELAVSHPLLHKSLGRLVPLDYFFENQVALESPIPMQTCLDLSQLATSSKDKAVLTGIGHSKKEYEVTTSLCGMKWIDVFKTFPSLSKRVGIEFLLCNMSMYHPRSYSIASCKAVVGSELHLVVGRFIYSRGGSKMEAGVCSSFLTSVEPGDEILFKIESAPSFHYPIDPSCPIIFVCTGTGFAPIRGLLQKRSYFQSRGEKLGPAFLIFGSRSSSEGLFHDEIGEFEKQGVLTKVFMCYSREMGEKKEYTTDKLRSKMVSKLLSPILAEKNTHIFICGSANMAEECKNALQDISSQECLGTIKEEGRLHCDVFGALESRKIKRRSNQSYCMGDILEDELDDSINLGDCGLDGFGLDDLGLEDLMLPGLKKEIPKPGSRSSSCIVKRSDYRRTSSNL